MIKKFSGLKRRVMLCLAAALTLVTGLVAVPASPVSAAGCRHYDTTAWDTPYRGEASDTNYYMYTPTYTVPYSSTCRDINLAAFTRYFGSPVCGYVRVRFFPSSGGSYANGWFYRCNATAPGVPIAYGVLDGTRYRIEIYGNDVVTLGIYD